MGDGYSLLSMQVTRKKIAELSWIALLGASACFCAYWLSVSVSVAFERVLDFRGYPTDGNFQVLNPLRRIALGQVPGKDFQFFHGILVPYLHFPLFSLTRGGVFGAEASRQFVSLGLFAITSVTFVWRAFDHWRLRLSALALFLYQGFSNLERVPLSQGYGSLLAVRSAVPVLVITLLLDRPISNRRAAIIGVLCAVAILCGTEQGLAAAIAVAGVLALTPGETASFKAKRLSRIVGGIGIGLSTFLLLLTRGSVSAALSILSFNLLSVPGDQFWYFGAPPNRFVSSVRDLFFNDSGGVLGVWIGLFLPVIAFLLLSKFLVVDLAAKRAWARTLAVSTVYGLISTASYFGISNPDYLEIAGRSILMGWIIVAAGFWRPLSDRAYVFHPTFRWLAICLRVELAIALAMYITCPTVDWPLQTLNLQLDRLSRRDFVYSQDWNRFLRDVKPLFAGKFCASPGRNDLLWSTYSGLLESRLGCLNPATDYVIHALGEPARDEYASRFRATRAVYVQTMDRKFFPYEDWVQDTSWSIYETLIAAYEPRIISPHSVFWARRPPGSEGPRVTEETTLDGDLLEAQGADLMIVTAHYEPENPVRLPMLKRMTRYLVTLSGAAESDAVTLDPNRREQSFPIIPRGKKVGLEFNAINPFSTPTPFRHSVTYRRVFFPPARPLWAKAFPSWKRKLQW